MKKINDYCVKDFIMKQSSLGKNKEYITACTGFVWNLFSLDEYLTQLRYSKEDYIVWRTFPKAVCLTLSEKWIENVVWGLWNKWEEGTGWELGLAFKMKTVCFPLKKLKGV